MSRYIDADALIADLKHDVSIDQDCLDYECLTDVNRANIQFDKDCKQNMIDLLAHSPTADVRENKHGRWIKYEDEFDFDYKCSECGCASWDNSDFCPDCGADMRGDTDG